MNVYLSNAAVSITVPYQDSLGNAVTPTAVSYRVLDGQGQEVIASTLHSGFTPGDTEITIEVDASNNLLDVGELRDLRVVEVIMTTANGEVINSGSYLIEATDTLEVMTNTFQSFGSAVLVAMEIAGIDAWSVAAERSQKTALINAFHAISNLSFYVTSGDAQDRLSSSVEIRDIKSLTAEELAALPEDFLVALKRAQIIEANAQLGGDPIGDKRRDGLMSETVGESSNMYRPGKPLLLPVSDDTMRALSRYVSNARRLGRG